MSDAAAGMSRSGAPADVAGRPASGDAGRAPRWDAALLAIGGAAACWALADTPLTAPGARVVLSAPVLLGTFDTLAALLVARPSPARRAADVIALIVVAAPFHLALAAAAGVPIGTGAFHAAWGVSLAAWGAAGVSAARAAVAGGALALVPSALLGSISAALPLAAYGAAEFLGWRSRAPFLASPLTGPAFVAHDGAFASAADALWPLAAAALVSLSAVVAGRIARGGR